MPSQLTGLPPQVSRTPTARVSSAPRPPKRSTGAREALPFMQRRARFFPPTTRAPLMPSAPVWLSSGEFGASPEPTQPPTSLPHHHDCLHRGAKPAPELSPLPPPPKWRCHRSAVPPPAAAHRWRQPGTSGGRTGASTPPLRPPPPPTPFCLPPLLRSAAAAPSRSTARIASSRGRLSTVQTWAKHRRRRGEWDASRGFCPARLRPGDGSIGAGGVAVWGAEGGDEVTSC